MTTVTASFNGEVEFKANGGGYVPSTDDLRELMAELFSGNDLMRWLDGDLYNEGMRISRVMVLDDRGDVVHSHSIDL